TKINVWASEPPLPPPEASPPSGPEPRDKSEFLQLIHKDACKTFNTVLGPRANAAHKNHFHVDMKVRRYVTICE
ncbi:MAG: extensin family protein, partial [Alphaproteobacteria bacterium]